MLRLLFLVLLPSIALADVYKCVNDGQTTYNEKPCASGAVKYAQRHDNVSEPVSSIIVRGADGRFYTTGFVNGVSVRFVVDTGASNSVLSGRAANRLGVKTCSVTGVSQTAGGAAAVCTGVFRTLSVSGFEFVNVPLLIIPTMTGDDGLIGMDLLSRLKFTQQNGVITLSR